MCWDAETPPGTARRIGRRLAAALAALLTVVAAPALAHKNSDAYLQLQATAQGLDLRWDIALRDLDNAVPVDADGDRDLTWGEVRAAWPALAAHARERIAVPGCALQGTGEPALERRSDGVYAALRFAAVCAPPAGLPIDYRLFAGLDANHRGIARLLHPDGRVEVRVLEPGAAGAAAGSAADAAQAAGTSFVREGVFHIVTGYDHLLFLLCLLLPAVLQRTPRGWRPVASARQALVPVAATVTLFTLAHSLTLALSALGGVSLPASLVEPAIAATIAVAALDNLRGFFGRARGWVTFLFGLVHGFGFAGVLQEVELPPADFGWALLRFNLGLELGQLAIVALVVPLLFLARRRGGYERWVLRAGSAGAVGVALLWFVERSAGIGLLPV
ncbi:HupE/UreJ family protein [Azohydromonas aeria]|uniref:HupE/UreJ family protein n=1 Tax=Azohydromonas aeria TaxID=2590212 RepID=UPI0012F78239|nr:HupE/UreJ family protein [Azohydromonas aeria]